jgi:hypothetical protein
VESVVDDEDDCVDMQVQLWLEVRGSFKESVGKRGGSDSSGFWVKARRREQEYGAGIRPPGRVST